MKSKNNLKGSQGQEPCNILTVTFQPYTIVFYFCLYFKEKINLNKERKRAWFFATLSTLITKSALVTKYMYRPCN